MGCDRHPRVHHRFTSLSEAPMKETGWGAFPPTGQGHGAWACFCELIPEPTEPAVSTQLQHCHSAGSTVLSRQQKASRSTRVGMTQPLQGTGCCESSVKEHPLGNACYAPPGAKLTVTPKVPSSYPRGPSGMALALRHVSSTLVPGSRTSSENEASLNSSFNSSSDMTSSASMLLW